MDELYRGGTSESRSYDNPASPTSGLRLSGRQLLKPSKNPKSFDSSSEENDGQFFSQGKENQFLKYGASNGQEGGASEEFNLEYNEGGTNGSAYDMASTSIKFS